MNIRKPHPDSCEQFQTIKKPNGNYKTERCYSYVGLLCEKGGTETAALRVDYCTNKTEAAEKLKKELAEVAGLNDGQAFNTAANIGKEFRDQAGIQGARTVTQVGLNAVGAPVRAAKKGAVKNQQLLGQLLSMFFRLVIAAHRSR